MVWSNSILNMMLDRRSPKFNNILDLSLLIPEMTKILNSDGKNRTKTLGRVLDWVNCYVTGYEIFYIKNFAGLR